MSDFLWVEKYRPKTIEECILPANTKKTFSSFLKKGEVPNLLLAGPAGCGKTTVAKALCHELGADFYVINGSDEGRFLDTVRNQAKNFASTVSLMGVQNIKLSSLMRQIIQLMMFNFYFVQTLKSSMVIVDLYLLATIRIK